MKTFRLALMTLTLLPTLALAQPPDADESAEHAEKQTRMMRVVGLAEELELNETQALKMADTMRQFDERRRPLMEQVRESAQVLRRAAEGDASAQSQVDASVQRIFDARTQLTVLDRDMFQALSKELTPQKRAQLAIFMARHDGKMMKVLKKFDREQHMQERMQHMQERMKRLQERMQQRGTGGQQQQQ
jgi:translation initiation factor 2B subunit (eIF-2B alpha/beta/delta family)